LDRRLGGPQSHSGRYGEEINLALPIAVETIRNGELQGLNFSRLIRMNKQRRVRLAGRVARMGEKKNAHIFLLAAKKRMKIRTVNTWL
jgi:hypothetical protein